MMTAEDLKYSILQLAMCGKLVEQRPEEGTGEELYKEIIKERQRLVKEGRIKKDKDQSEKNEEPPFDIPESWQWAKLNDIVAKTIKRGKSPKYAQKSNTLVFAQKCNTKAGFIDLSLCLYLDEKLLPKYPEDEYMVNEDIVINSTGNGTLGRVGVYRDSDNPDRLPLVPDSHVTVIRCSSLMDVGYVFYCLKYYQPYMEKLGSGSTNQTELGAGILKELSFPIPPLAEQKRIVAKIEELMPFVEQYAAASTKLNTLNATFPEMMKKSILQEAVQGKLVPQDPNDEPASVLLEKIAEEKKRLIKEGIETKDNKSSKIIHEDGHYYRISGKSKVIIDDEIPFDIPDNWEWKSLGEIEEINLGFTYRPQYVEDGVFFLSVKDISRGSINFNDAKKVSIETYEKASYGSKPHRGDILFGRVGTMGKPQIVDTDVKFCIFVSLGFLRDHTNMLDKNYIRYWMQSYLFDKQVEANVKGSAQKNLNTGWLKEFLVPIPPLEEQHRIVEKLNCVLKLIWQ